MKESIFYKFVNNKYGNEILINYIDIQYSSQFLDTLEGNNLKKMKRILNLLHYIDFHVKNKLAPNFLKIAFEQMYLILFYEVI